MPNYSTLPFSPKILTLSCSVATVLLVSVVSLPVALAQTPINSGGVQNVSTQIGRVTISNGTQLNVLTNGEVSQTAGSSATLAATVSDTSILSVSGGSVRSTTSGADAIGVVATGDSLVQLSAGEIRATTSTPGNATGVIARGNSRFEFTGGDISGTTNASGGSTALLLEDSATALLSGGDNSFGNFVANDQSSIDVVAGAFTFANFVANGDSTIVISGGDFSQNDLFSNDQATIVLQGSSFNLPFGEVIGTGGTISGTLLDGTSFGTSFQRQGTASIVLSSVPEPSSLLMLAISGIGLALPRSRRKLRAK